MDTTKEPTACMKCGKGDEHATNHTICGPCLELHYPEPKE